MRETKSLRLRPWEEVVGVVKGTRLKRSVVVLVLEGIEVNFPVDSKEAEVLKDLDDSLIGKRIGVLRTDLPSRPLLVRREDS